MEKHLPNGEAMADKDHREHYTVSSDIPICPLSQLRQTYQRGRATGSLSPQGRYTYQRIENFGQEFR